MKTYEITHKRQKHHSKGDNLIKTLVLFCAKENIDIDEIESCVLVNDDEEQLLKDLQIVSEILLKYGEVIFDNGLIKNDPDPRKKTT